MTRPRHVVFYGSLRVGLHLGGEPPFAALVRRAGPCRLRGSLYEVGDGAYPGLDPRGEGVVHGDLYEVLDESVFDLLDEWEGFDPAEPGSSPYVRRAVRLLAPPVEAWVYEGRHAERGRPVPSGDWRRHVADRGR